MTPWATSCAGVPAAYFQAVLCSDQAGADFLRQTCPMHLYNSQYHAVKLSMYTLWHLFLNDLYNNKIGWKSDISARIENFLNFFYTIYSFFSLTDSISCVTLPL